VKFVVDGTVWTTASSLPTVDDGAGNGALCKRAPFPEAREHDEA
jgi:hypothetical protein